MPVYPANINYKPDMGAFRVLSPYRKARWTEFEDGPPLGRKSGIHRLARLAYRIPFQQTSDYEIFQHFAEVELSDGTARFTMPVWKPSVNDYVVRTVQIEEGDFSGEPWGLGMQASFTLLVYNW